MSRESHQLSLESTIGGSIEGCSDVNEVVLLLIGKDTNNKTAKAKEGTTSNDGGVTIVIRELAEREAEDDLDEAIDSHCNTQDGGILDLSVEHSRGPHHHVTTTEHEKDQKKDLGVDHHATVINDLVLDGNGLGRLLLGENLGDLTLHIRGGQRLLINSGLSEEGEHQTAADAKEAEDEEKNGDIAIPTSVTGLIGNGEEVGETNGNEITEDITQHVNGPEETSLAASVLVGGALVDVHALGSPNDASSETVKNTEKQSHRNEQIAELHGEEAIFVGADADGPARLTKLENDGWSKNVENGEGKVNDTEASSADIT